MPVKPFSFAEYLTDGGDSRLGSLVVSQSYERMAWVYAAVNKIATTASRAPLNFYNGKPNGNRRHDASIMITDRDSPIYQFFEPPKAPEIPSFRELIYRTFTHLGIEGGIYWIILLKKGKPFEIDIRTKAQLKPILSEGSSGKLIGWEERTSETKSKTYRPEEVLPINYYNPKNTFIGLSPLAAARLSLESEYNISGWNASFFKTGMKNPLLVHSKATLTERQKLEIKKEIQNYYSGIDGAHGALLLQGNVEATPLTISSKDIDFIQGKKLNREEILAIFGVPPALVGVYEFSSYANANAQIRIFWETTILPKMDAILDLLQVNVLDKYFPGVYGLWDPSKVPGLDVDPIELSKAVKAYRDSGLKFNVIGKILNMPVLEDLEESEETVTDNTPAEPAPTEDEEPDNNAFDIWSKQDIELTNLYVDRIESALSTFCTSLHNAVKKGTKLREDFWLKVWDDLINKSLTNYFEKVQKNTVVFTNHKNWQSSVEVADAVSKHLSGSRSIAKNLIATLSNQDDSLYLTVMAEVEKMATSLVVGTRELTRTMIFKQNGEKTFTVLSRGLCHKDGEQLLVTDTFHQPLGCKCALIPNSLKEQLTY